MLRTIAYIIFLCTGLFALTLIVLFFQSQKGLVTGNVVKKTDTSGISLSVNTKIIDKVNKWYKFRNSEEKDIFWAFIFTFPVEIRVADRVRMFLFENDYALVRRNILLLSPMYNFQDTADFYGKTLFLNDKTWDGQIVRFVTEIDGHAVGFEVLRDEFPNLKSLILQ